MIRSTKNSYLRRAALVGVCSLATLLTVSCGEAPSDGETEETATPTTAEKVKKEVREAAAAIKSYSFEQKDEFAEWGNKRIAKLDSRLDELRQQGSGLAGEAKAEWESEVADLEKRKKELQAQLNSAVKSTSEGWSELSKGFSEAQKDLAKAIREAGKKLGAEDGDEGGEPADDG